MPDLRVQAFSVAHVTGEKRPVVFLHVAEAEVERLREALRFYADMDTYTQLRPTTGPFSVGTTLPIHQDRGQRARAALALSEEGR